MSLPYKLSACFSALLAASPAFGQVLPNSIDCAAWEKQPNGSSYKAINDTEIKMANGATLKIGKDVVAEKRRASTHFIRPSQTSVRTSMVPVHKR